MPRRNAITISLSDDLLAALDTMVPTHGSRSAAIQALIHDAGPNPQVSVPPRPVNFTPAGRYLTISPAGWAALDRIAADGGGRDVEEVARLALRYATQYPARWL